MMSEDWLSSFFIYYDNLSNYYLFCLIISFSAVVITWWFTHSKFKPSSGEITNEREPEDDSSDRQDGSLLAQIKMARQEAIVQRLSADLTEDQLEEERETEKQQLAAIFQLLQEQGEKFQVGSMEELEDQLRLYRR